MKIFSHTWEEIKSMQQKTYVAKTIPFDTVQNKADIERDINQFRIPVHKDVVDAYGLKLPAGYKLENGTYRFLD